MDFEKSLNDLEIIVESLESGQLSLEESLERFEAGIKLSRLCQTALKNAEQQLQILIEQNGELSAQPFLSESDD